jgi:hypothetical protein
MKKIILTSLIILPLFTPALTCFADKPCMKTYFKAGGITTALVKEGARSGVRVDQGKFLEVQDSIMTENGDIFIKVFGHFTNDEMDRTYVVELPLNKRKKVVSEFYDKNKHVSGMHTLRLKKKYIHQGDGIWEKVSLKATGHMKVVQISNRKEIYKPREEAVSKEDRLYFIPPSGFAFESAQPIIGETGYWVFFNASPATYPHRWMKGLVPVTYVFDVLTLPVQLPLMKWAYKF